MIINKFNETIEVQKNINDTDVPDKVELSWSEFAELKLLANCLMILVNEIEDKFDLRLFFNNAKEHNFDNAVVESVKFHKEQCQRQHLIMNNYLILHHYNQTK